MRKLYILLPILGTLAFGYLYQQHASQAAEHERQRQQDIQATLQRRQAAEADAREKAIQETLQIQAQRRKERQEREAAETARKEHRQKLIADRDTARRDTENKLRRIDALKKDIATEQNRKTTLENERKIHLAETQHQKNATAKIHTETQHLQRTLDTLNQAPTTQATNPQIQATKKS
jgi:hypothetical protein